MITKKYIKMCEKAEKIQEIWKPKVGDWIYFSKLNKIFLITIVKKEVVEYIDPITREDSWCYKENIKTYFKWLPTQEQLQGAMREKSNEHFFKNFPKNYIPQKDEYVFPIHLFGSERTLACLCFKIYLIF